MQQTSSHDSNLHTLTFILDDPWCLPGGARCGAIGYCTVTTMVLCKICPTLRLDCDSNIEK